MLKVSQLFQVCVRRQLWRNLSSAAASGEKRPPPRRRVRVQVRTCTVDPTLEERFVFPDCPGPEEDPREEEELLRQLRASVAPPEAAPRVQVSPDKHLRSAERQLQVLKSAAVQEAKLSSEIQFQDVDFPLDENLVRSSKKKKKKKKGDHKIFGTPDVDEPISDTRCSGCGATLHCTTVSVPGYLPCEKYKVLLQDGRLGGATCQRCYLLSHHQKALHLEMSHSQYRDVVRQVRDQKALVLLIVDLLDLPASIVPDLPGLVGTNKYVVVLGNKADLLPRDAPNYLQRIKRQLAQYCDDAGFGSQVCDVHLISAKTGFGIENLISSLQRAWKYKGDVYLVGSSNAGKSTLFNTLLESDYCKTNASDVISKATISPWPGTTLNLLKFPIINPTPYRMFRRKERLKEAGQQTEAELQPEELNKLKGLSKHGYLVGRVGRTFRPGRTKRKEVQFDPDSLAFGDDKGGELTEPAPPTDVTPPLPSLSYNEVKDAHWLYDTPGIMKERDILHLLQDHEVRLVVPTKAIVPRTFVLKPGWSLFVGALARIDFLQGTESCWFSVLVSNRVPVHVTSLDKADDIYKKHAGHALLGVSHLSAAEGAPCGVQVPSGGEDRMKQFPAMDPQDFTLEGRGHLDAAADITLSSAGWVAVTAAEGDQVQVRVHGPAAAGICLRTPPLLPHVVTLKGERVPKSPAYRRPGVVATLDGLSTAGAQKLHVRTKK